MDDLSCFKAYDIRGRLGYNLDAGIAYRIGRGLARALKAETVVLSRDIRESSEMLADAVLSALIDEGCNVLNLGLAGTEEMYFATSHFQAHAGICVTASHNPIDYNGMKIVRSGSAPLDPDTELAQIKSLAERNDFGCRRPGGAVHEIAREARAAYVERILGFVSTGNFKPLRIVVNAGNGAAGPTFDAIAEELLARGAPLEFIRMHHVPDGTFPNGIPNPLLPENRAPTAQRVQEEGADFGVAWDGDFDRCFLFDHKGNFIAGEYVVGLLSEAFLAKSPGATIIHDPRVIWNTRDIVDKHGGVAVQSRTGHAFVKRALRDENAVYGGEMSAHHYFRDFFYCDSGMIPWLLIAELVSRFGKLEELVKNRVVAFPSSGEINFALDDAKAAVERVRATFEPQAFAVDRTDGISLDMGKWRFNLRSSNTEPIVRLNVEAKGDNALVELSVDQITKVLVGKSALNCTELD